MAHPGNATPFNREDEFEVDNWRELIDLDAGERALVWKIDDGMSDKLQFVDFTNSVGGIEPEEQVRDAVLLRLLLLDWPKLLQKLKGFVRDKAAEGRAKERDA